MVFVWHKVITQGKMAWVKEVTCTDSLKEKPPSDSDDPMLFVRQCRTPSKVRVRLTPHPQGDTVSSKASRQTNLTFRETAFVHAWKRCTSHSSLFNSFSMAQCCVCAGLKIHKSLSCGFVPASGRLLVFSSDHYLCIDPKYVRVKAPTKR